MPGGGGHHACMFVCHDKKWHNRYPTQCRVVEGIMHVCLYVMIKSGTIDIQHSAGWWRFSVFDMSMFFYILCLTCLCISILMGGAKWYPSKLNYFN